MTDIEKNIRSLRGAVPEPVRIVAVSKTMPVGDVMKAYNAGHRTFGENRIAELLQKKDQLPTDIEWHFIGHLQSKKAKLLVSRVKLIESVDSQKLLGIIDNESQKCGIISDCLLQFHVAKEETKYGFSLEEAESMINSGDFKNYSNIRICGIMGMATFTDDEEVVRGEFRLLKEIFIILKRKYFNENPSFSEISMGMSGDYKIALEEGSTIIRIGSLIFGER